MIHMPHRSVTRFFVPMIDVLLLLFCIFLLMPIKDEKDMDQAREDAAVATEITEETVRELEGQTKKLQQYEQDRPRLDEIADMRAEIERLKNIERQHLKQKYDFQIIDIDRDSGDISYYDTTLPSTKARRPIASEKDAKELMKRLEARAGGRKVYFHFLYPRPKGGFPTAEDVERYKEWFEGAETSLK